MSRYDPSAGRTIALTKRRGNKKFAILPFALITFLTKKVAGYSSVYTFITGISETMLIQRHYANETILHPKAIRKSLTSCPLSFYDFIHSSHWFIELGSFTRDFIMYFGDM